MVKGHEFEEAIEASSNSLQQIAACLDSCDISPFGVSDRILDEDTYNKLRHLVSRLAKVMEKKMGNSRIVDIRGFEISSKDESILSVIDYALNEPGAVIENEAIKAILALDKNINTVMACQVTASGPMAIGWENFKEASEEKMGRLKNILIGMGLSVKPIEKDRFITYG